MTRAQSFDRQARLIQPRYPSYLQPPSSVDDLLPDAVRALERTSGRGALGRVRREDRVLIVAPDEPVQDPRVLEAVCLAFKDRGISVTTVTESEMGVTPPPESMPRISALDGWKELLWQPENAAMFRPELAQHRPDFSSFENRGQIKPFLDRYPEFTAVYAGVGGRRWYRKSLEEHAPKFKDNWTYYSWEDLRSRESDFPSDLLALIEQKMVAPLGRVEEAVITDLQGSELWFRLTEHEAALWAEKALTTGHLYMYPAAARCFGDPDPEEWVLPEAEGVMAGTANHVGFVPHVRVYVSGGVATRVEGGGLFGELARQLLARTQHVQFPFVPRPGYLYLVEAAMGTNPKAFRQRSNLFDTTLFFPNAPERNCAGVIHWGFGMESVNPEYIAWAQARGLPYAHGMHVHTYFTTYDVKLRGSGEWLRLIDRGRMSALDDPEVRALAERYGDPDELLREDWVPAIPGINYPGDYLRDYGNDPASWVRRELEGRLPETIGVPG